MFKLFVGGLPYATTSDELKDFFATCGEVEEAHVVVDRETKRSRGFGFVTFVNDADGKKAVTELNNAELGGRTIIVSEAREKER